MKKLVFAVAMAAGLSAGPVLAAEDPVWGAWASTDDDALAQILATNGGPTSTGAPALGPEDAALLDVGSLLSDLANTINTSSGGLVDPCDVLPICEGGGVGGGLIPENLLLDILSDPEALLEGVDETAEELIGSLPL